MILHGGWRPVSSTTDTAIVPGDAICTSTPVCSPAVTVNGTGVVVR